MLNTKLLPLVACGLLAACSKDTIPDSSHAGSSQGGNSAQGGGNQQGAAGTNTSLAGTTVTVTPKSVAVLQGGRQAFSCAVTGSANPACLWKVIEPGGGSIDATGAYVAPAALGTYHVIAVSAADAGASDTATVTVTDHKVGTCDNLPALRTWENVTPLALNSSNWCVPGAPNCKGGQLPTYGTNAFVVDPNNAGTVYLGTASLGIWKTTDCGSSWIKVNTGASQKEIDVGRGWSMLIDPTDSNTLYTVTGYGGPGFYKTTNGGKDWQQRFSADVFAGLPGQGIEKLSMDPTNNLHLTASFHNPCKNSPMGGGDWACMAETRDGGATFTFTNSAENWTEGDGQTMLNDKTWFFSSGGGNIWRTTDGGGKWDMVHDGFSVGQYNANGCIYTAHDGTFYTGGSRGMASSADGITWNALSNSPNIGGPNGGCPIVDDGKNLFVSEGLAAYDPPNADWFRTAPSAAPTAWVPMNNPAVITGAGWLGYDKDHKLLYASNSTAGFFRVVVE